MDKMSDELLYKNLIAAFFAGRNLIAEHKHRIDNCFNFVAEKLPPLTVRARETILKTIKSVEITFLKRWRKFSYADLERFQHDNEKWVNTSLKLPASVTTGSKKSNQEKKEFYQLSERQKNRRVEDLVENDIAVLLLASAKAAKKINRKDLERVLRMLTKDDDLPTKILNLLKDDKPSDKLEKITPLRGLTYLLDSNLSKSQYIKTRLLSKEHKADIFPAYNKIRDTKAECRPPAIFMMVNDVSAALPLQELLNHTASRLLLLQTEVLQAVQSIHKNALNLKLQIKWGVDGSSDHARYNQKFENENTENSDANLFATTMVPLRITMNKDSKIIIWNNSTPQSARWCRPIRLHFVKETEEFTNQEIQSVQSEIETLNSLVVTISGIEITVQYELYMTMIDGKVLAAATNTKSKQRCCICKATPKQFNNLKDIKIRFKPVDEYHLKYGLSVLHLWIRCFEWLLHVSYRIEFKKWQLRGSVLQERAKNRKIYLQSRFFEIMKLRVDFPSSKGSGNSNSGNVCRTAFKDPEKLADILELDEELINRIRVILIALSCQFPLQVELFSDYCLETAHHYVKHYNWFPMPPSVHKVLIHSRDVLLANDLPVGVLAEDAAESCNKFYRNNREFHARKNNRQNNLKDVFNRALDSSDPLVASYGSQERRNCRRRKDLPPEVIHFLQSPDAPNIDEVDESNARTETDADDMEDILEQFAEDLDELDLPEDPFYDDTEEDEDNNDDLF